MDEWYGAPYRYGGYSKSGIDCSAFTASLLSGVYRIIIPRTVKEQYEAGIQIQKEELLEGDLIFFNIQGSISHVGVYLMNNKFIHASTTNGVIINDLNDDYYNKKYIGARRFKWQ
jgi:lipoprotein Spr